MFYKYLFCKGIEPATRSTADDRSVTATTVPSDLSQYKKTQEKASLLYSDSLHFPSIQAAPPHLGIIRRGHTAGAS